MFIRFVWIRVVMAAVAPALSGSSTPNETMPVLPAAMLRAPAFTMYGFPRHSVNERMRSGP